MLCDVVLRHRRRWAHAPVIHAGSRFDAWDPISMHSIIMVLRLAAFWAAGDPL